MQGILLIGMPGAGKSSIGKRVAGILGFRFIDGDEEIEKKLPDRQSFLDKHGGREYVKMEEKTVTRFPTKKVVLAPGGSTIYSKKATAHFRGCLKIMLGAPFSIIEKRIANVNERGIVWLKEKGLKGLYRERTKLFRKYADATINTGKKSEKELADDIVKLYCLNKLSGKTSPMKYRSTNSGKSIGFSKALLRGLAPDKGLYVPERIPKFSMEDIALMKHLGYAQLAFVVLRRFVGIRDADLMKMCEDAYNFIIPIEKHGGLYIARFDRGPSLSFKDFAAQLLSRLIDYYAGKGLTVLAATSGDTGSAVAEAFRKNKKANVVILIPKNEVTATQRRQMTTVGGNVKAVLVDGKFDDCQALAKKSLSELKGLTSANSINVGRLLPQIVYYFHIYSCAKAKTFVVPSGNFGNLVAGLMAKKMGLPIRLVAAVNENDEFPRFLRSGKYVPVNPSKKCMSNAMNVGNPSNLARLIWLYGGKTDEKGGIKRLPNMRRLRQDILSASVTDAETRAAIKKAYSKGIVLEPHGAVGFAAIRKLKLRGDIALFETAHPAKFSEELDKLGIRYETPESLARLARLTEKYTEIHPDFKSLKKVLASNRKL